MEFLKIVKRRSFLSEVLYIALNVGLAIALMIIVRVTNSLLAAFAFVLLSHWRILAVRTRFWFANIQANLISIIVGFSFVIMLYLSNTSAGVSDSRIFAVQCFFTLLYICWLLFLKPRSKRVFIVAQAFVALFCGVTSIYSMFYGWPASLVVLLVWLMGYSTSRHIMSNYDEPNLTLLSLAWGLMLAELGWVAYHWTIAYRLPVITNIMIPQFSIIIFSFGFLGYKAYDSYHHHGQVRMHDILLPMLFAIAITAVLLTAFNGVPAGS